MKTIKGPAIFLAQFAGDEAPFNSLGTIAKWAAGLGYKGVQIPSWDGRLFDLEKAAISQDLLRRDQGRRRASNGVEITELSTHLQGQLVAVHPAYDAAFDGFAAPEVRGNPKARQEWAVDQVKTALKASQQSRPDRAWRPSPARSPGPSSIRGRSARPAWSRPPSTNWPSAGGRSSTMPTDCGVDVCFEIHPGEDLHDGVTFEMFLERVGNHPRCDMLYDPSHFVLQQLDYLDLHRHLPRADPRLSTSRTPSSTRPAGRASMAASSPGSTAPGASARSATARSISARIFSKLAGVRLRRLGGARMGMLPEASRARRARGRAVHRRPHHPRHRAGLRRFRRRAAPTRRPTARCSAS